MPSEAYYQSDLAWVHHSGYSQHVERVAPGIVRLLRDALGADAHVLDAGCGSGLLARRLRAEGFLVHGVDASAAMIDLAREHEPSADFAVIRLPTGLPAGAAKGLPVSDGVVSTGHVLNYLDTREQIAQALGELAQAVRPGGLLAIDLMTEGYRQRPDLAEVYAKVHDDWVIVTRFSRPQPYRFDRALTVFRLVAGTWRRSDEQHRNVTFEPDEALRVLRQNGIDATVRTSFGSEQLGQGLVVLAGVRR